MKLDKSSAIEEKYVSKARKLNLTRTPIPKVVCSQVDNNNSHMNSPPFCRIVRIQLKTS